MEIVSETNQLSVRLENRDEMQAFAEAMDYVRRNMPAHKKAPAWKMLVELSEAVQKAA